MDKLEAVIKDRLKMQSTQRNLMLNFKLDIDDFTENSKKKIISKYKELNPKLRGNFISALAGGANYSLAKIYLEEQL